MEEKKKLKVEVEIWGIEVEETSKHQGWYKFEYSIRINGGKKENGECDGSWSNQTRVHFEKVLKKGYAARKVLEERL